MMQRHRVQILFPLLVGLLEAAACSSGSVSQNTACPSGQSACGATCCTNVQTCVDGACVDACTPSPACGDSDCGSDSCGTACGVNGGGCASGQSCTTTDGTPGTCQSCTPSPVCGASDCGFDGCDTPCGANAGGCPTDETCDKTDGTPGTCLNCTPSPACGESDCGSDSCGTACGVNGGGCPTEETCSTTDGTPGTCMSCTPSPACGDSDCGFDSCGTACGVNNGACSGDMTCSTSDGTPGTCQSCTPSPACDASDCGFDSCGTACGTNNGGCPTGDTCSKTDGTPGTCQAGSCTPNPACGASTCGFDSCGTACGPKQGKCPTGQTCSTTDGTPGTCQSGGPQIVFPNAPITMKAGVCSPALTIQTQDGNGNAVTQTAALTVAFGFNANLVSGTQSSPDAYTDSACATAKLPKTGAVGKAGYHSFGQTTIPVGSSTVTIYVIPQASLFMDVSAAATGYVYGDQVEDVLPGDPLTVVVSGPDTLGTGACSKTMLVRALDPYLNPTNVSGSTSITLTGLGSATVYSDAACTTTVTGGQFTMVPSTTIYGTSGGPSSDIPFYLKDNTSEHLSLQATVPSPLTLLYGVELWVTPLANSGQPIPPQQKIVIPAWPSGGTIVNVADGGDVQAALNSANPGDTIVLAAGGTYKQMITLPAKDNPNGKYINIISSELSSLPPQGQRVSPADAAHMPKIVAKTSTQAMIANFASGTTSPAAYYRLIGLEVLVPDTQTTVQYALLDLGGNADAGSVSQASALPHHIFVESSYVHGNSVADLQHCIKLAGVYEAVVDSYVSDCHYVGADATAVGSRGPGPYKIANNYLEASGENVLFGGAPAFYPNDITSDVEILHNTFDKPVSWNPIDPTFQCVTRNGNCKHWTVKNLLELKVARRVTVDGNTFRHNWVDGQTGFALLITPRGSGVDFFIVTEDIAYTNNTLAHSMNGLDFARWDSVGPVHSQDTTRVLFENNTMVDVGSSSWGGYGGSVYLLDASFDNFTFNHNTLGFSATGQFWEGGGDGAGYVNMSLTNNIMTCGKYGFHINGTSNAGALTGVYVNPVVTNNVLVGCAPTPNRWGSFTTTNYLAADVPTVEFTTWAADSPANDSDDLALQSGSPYYDLLSADPVGQDLGVDWVTLEAHVQ